MVRLETGTRHAVLLNCISLLIWLAALDTTTGGFAYADPDDFAREIARVERLVSEGSFPVALALADSLLDAAVGREPPDPGQVASALDARVSVQLYLSGDDVADAVENARRAVALREELDGDPSLPLSETLRNLGVLLRQRERYAEARETLDRALAMASSADPPDSLQISSCLGDLATLCTETGEYDLAFDYFERDLAIAEKRYTPDDVALIRKYLNLSRLYRRVADYDNALECIRRSMEPLRATDPDHANLAYVYNALGSTRGEMGQAQQSYEAYQRAMEITRDKFGEEHVLTWALLNNLGIYYFEILDYDRAEEYLVNALELGRKLWTEESGRVATPMANLASVYRERGDYTQAESLYLRSLKILEPLIGSDHPIVARRLQELGWVRIYAGRPDEAEADFQRAWEIRIAKLGQGNFEVGQALTGRARARQDQGKLEEARADYEAGCEIIESNMGPHHPYLVEPLVDYALLLLELDRLEEAAVVALRAESVSRDYLQSTSSFLSEQEALQFSTARVKGTDILFTLATVGVDERTAFDQLVRSRSVVLDEMAARRAGLVDAGDPEALQVMRDLAVRSREYAELLTAGSGTGPDYQVNLRDAQLALESSQRELADVSARYRRDQTRRRAGIVEVLAALPPDAALLAYVRHKDMRPASDSGPRAERPELYSAFVVDGGELRVIEIGSAAEVDQLVHAWRRQAASPPATTGEAARYAEAASKLRAKVWDPVTSRVQGASHLFVVPDGELHLVNWSVLTSDDGVFLAESAPPIHYLSAERDLIQTPAPGVGLLAIGGVDYEAGATAPMELAVVPGGETDPDPFAALQFDPLPGTERELDAVSSIWSSGTADETPMVVLRGTEATESAFRADATGKRVVHLATHAFVFGTESRAGPGSRGIGGVAELAPEAKAMLTAGGARLRLSGLALAGANLRGQVAPGEDDGILTALEIAAYDLGSVEWAVLSACDTGRGEIRVGEGVLGLRRAFQIAGARTLIMSLWPVDDASAEQWMRALYRARFEDGLTTNDAVQAASLEVLHSRRADGLSDHPFYWGGFVAAGSWK